MSAVNRFPSNYISNSRNSRSKFRNINNDKQFIFIHIPKTGGSSIENLFFNRHLDSEHKTMKEYLHYYRYRKYFKFSFVRNPYLRIISMFIYFKEGGNKKHDKWKMCKIFAEFNDLDDFIHYLINKQHNIKDHEFFSNLSQTDYLFYNKYTVDFIGKFEDFEQDIKRLMNKLNLKITAIPHDNYNGNKSKYDGLLVTPKFIEFVNNSLHDDFKNFGYNQINITKSITLKQFKCMI
eukprot:111592_1